MTKNNGRIGILLKLAPFAVLVVCLVVTLLLWNVVRQNALNDLQKEFDDEVQVVHSRLNERLGNYRDILRGAAGLFAASQSVQRKEFLPYINSLDLEQAYPGIQGVGFSLLIPAREKTRQIEAIRRQGFPQFSIKPEGARDPYSAIIYLEPFDWRNQRALGYDMYSEPIRREAMERARDGDAEALSGKVLLMQEVGGEAQSGFLLYKPVYRNNLPHETIQERHNNLVGWVYEPFRMNDLMNKGVLGRYLDTVRDELDIEIYDGDSPDEKSIMFDSTKAGLGYQSKFTSIRSTQYFGRNWTIAVRSLPAFEAQLKVAQSRTILIGGSVISLLLMLVVWLLATTNTRAIKLAGKMSKKLELTLTQTISGLAAVIEMRDPYTAGHQRRAADLASAIATEMELSGEQIQSISLAAMTYEIGKIKIPAEILSKPGRLDQLEYELIKIHAQAGFEILREIDFPWPIALTVQQHHERLDGSGYPLGLKGGEILLEARIIAVADVVEAMFSHRPYRPALGVDAALAEITANRGVLYDPAAVDACVRLFRDRGYHFPG
jgi:HD-GYP domain-containing protein (c-di-GMP phosphodiesterase class II)